MKVEAVLRAIRALPIASPDRLTGGGPFVVLSPHPDDETLGCGGLIATACAAGQDVEVVILTDGAGSHLRSKAYPQQRLIPLRKQEAAQATRRLGLPAAKLSHLDWPDAQAPSEGAVFEAAVAALAEMVDRRQVRTLFVTWGRDPHCDHEAADHLARALRRRCPALKLWSYPIWGWHLPSDGDIDVPEPNGYRIDIAEWRAVKRGAIAAYTSQMTDLIADDPDGFRFTERTLAPFLGPFEYFIETPA